MTDVQTQSLKRHLSLSSKILATSSSSLIQDQIFPEPYVQISDKKQSNLFFKKILL